jgi:hypothetical protein
MFSLYKSGLATTGLMHKSSTQLSTHLTNELLVTTFLTLLEGAPKRQVEAQSCWLAAAFPLAAAAAELPLHLLQLQQHSLLSTGIAAAAAVAAANAG